MTWLKLDADFFTHPKVIGLTNDARALYLAGLCYCATHATDGLIGGAALRVIAAEVDVKAKLAGTLVHAGLWHEVEDGFEVHDYGEHQRDAETVKRERANGRERVRAYRERQRNGVTNASRNATPSRVSNGARGEERRGEDLPPHHEVTHAAAVIVARHRLDRRRLVEPKVVSENRWLARVVEDVETGEAERAAYFVAQEPDLTPERLAELLEDVPGDTSVVGPNADCPKCDGTGWIEQQSGAVDRCACDIRRHP